jgi:hypothetical protein
MSRSHDGYDWEAATVVLQPSNGFNMQSVCDPTVVQFKGTWFLYHTCINTVSPPDGYTNNRYSPQCPCVDVPPMLLLLFLPLAHECASPALCAKRPFLPLVCAGSALLLPTPSLVPSFPLRSPSFKT